MFLKTLGEFGAMVQNSKIMTKFFRERKAHGFFDLRSKNPCATKTIFYKVLRSEANLAFSNKMDSL